MDDLIAVDVIKRKAQLHKPAQACALGKNPLDLNLNRQIGKQ